MALTVPIGCCSAMYRSPSASGPQARASAPVSTARMPPALTSSRTAGLGAFVVRCEEDPTGCPGDGPGDEGPCERGVERLDYPRSGSLLGDFRVVVDITNPPSTSHRSRR